MQQPKNQKRKEVEGYYDVLVSKLYTEPPVDVWKFMSDPKYLGNSTSNGESIYPVWRDALVKIFEDGTKSTIVLTGSTSTGKSSVAVWAMAYVQYLHMIMRDPWKMYGLAPSPQMSISFFNLNKTLGQSRGYGKLQDALFKSPWFRDHALRAIRVRTDPATGKQTGELEFALFKYLLSSPNSSGFGILGEEVVSGILDEVDDPITSIKKKAKVVDAFDATEIRFKQRFASTGYSLGKLFIVSSKQDEMSFIDTFVARHLNFPDVLVFDIPVWEAKKEAQIYSGAKFPVAIGDAYHPPKILEPGQEAEFHQQGYRIIQVPIEYKPQFQLNIIKALKDIAGETVAGVRKSKLFVSEIFITDCMKDPNKQDPVNVSEVLTGLKDEVPYIKYFDLSKIRTPKTVPRFFHYDISYSGEGDACSLSMAGVKDWKVVDIQNEDGTYRRELVPVVETDFSIRIKGHPGDRIPFHKVRKLVLDLRAAGFNIALFTADLANMSEDTKQLLMQAGIPTDALSLDKSPQEYLSFRDLVYESRWVCHKIPMLVTELSQLEHDTVTGKIDHPEDFLNDLGEVVKGSKDLADSTAGAVCNVLRNAKPPMDVDSMVKAMQASTAKSEKVEDDITNLLTPPGAKKEDRIIGTQQHDTGIQKMQDIFRRLHPGS